MPQSLTMRISDETFAALKGQADLESLALSDVARRYLDAGMAAPPATATPPPVTLPEAAQAIIAAMPEGYGTLIGELCRDEGHEPHEYVISHCMLAWERNETAQLIGAEDRHAAAVPRALPPPAQGETRPCDYCHRPFVVTRQGQRFCPPPDPDTKSCGRLFTETELHARRPPDKLSRSHQIAQRVGIEPRGPVTIPQADLVAALKTALAEMGLAGAGKTE